MCKLCTTSRIVNSAFRVAYHSLCCIFPPKIKQNSTERVFLTFIWMENGATVVAQFRQHSIPLFEAICQPFWIFSCICVCCGLLASHSIYILSFFSYYIFYMCFLLFFSHLYLCPLNVYNSNGGFMSSMHSAYTQLHNSVKWKKKYFILLAVIL